MSEDKQDWHVRFDQARLAVQLIYHIIHKTKSNREPALLLYTNPNYTLYNNNNGFSEDDMADGLEFDPAMFGMKANHGMLRPDKANSKPTASQQPFHPGTGSNSTTLNSAEGGGQSVRGDRGAFQRGGNRGGRGNSHRGRGGNRGGRGGQNHRTNEGQPFKVRGNKQSSRDSAEKSIADYCSFMAETAFR